jgi:citrate lyase subunit beta/citryl-CoA lyase
MEVVVRINGLDTKYHKEDLEKIVSDNIDTIMLPKATIEYVNELDKLLTEIESRKQMSKKIKVLPIIELAISVLQVDTIASLNRVDGILLGAEDLTSDMEVVRTKKGTEIEYPRAKVAMACKAYKIDAIDTPFTDVNDNLGLKDDALHAMQLGMNCKAAIHPNQLDTINEVFMPSQTQIIWASRVMKANEDANAKGLGVFSLDGKMVDKPVLDRARKILAKAKKFGAI